MKGKFIEIVYYVAYHKYILHKKRTRKISYKNICVENILIHISQRGAKRRFQQYSYIILLIYYAQIDQEKENGKGKKQVIYHKVRQVYLFRITPLSLQFRNDDSVQMEHQ